MAPLNIVDKLILFWLPCLHWFILNLFWFSFSGYSSGRLNGTSMHGALAGARGPFTPSQWMALEHQALIYKYLTANMLVPSNLLIPIRKALDFAGFSSFTKGLLRPNTCKIRKARFLTSTRLASQISLKMPVEIKISSAVAQTSKEKIKVD